MTVFSKIKSRHIIRAWEKAFGEMAEDHLLFSNTLLTMLAEGDPVKLNTVEEKTGIPFRRLKKLVKKSPVTVFNEDHLIVGHDALRLEESLYEMKVNVRTFYAPSAIDALRLPHRLKSSMQLKTCCKSTGDTIEISLSPSGFETNLDDMWVSLPLIESLNLNSLAELDKSSFIFRDFQVAEEWLEQQEEMCLVTISQAFQISRDVSHSIDSVKA